VRHCFVYFLVLISLSSLSWAQPFKVLVVMSYEKNNPWCKEIKEGIKSVLDNKADITYFYMDTKVNLNGGIEKGKQALALYEELKPDGVITADDNAQSMFVLPYLNDKVTTPVFFCGVNSDAKKYHYPSSNVTGVLERGHIRESVAFIKQLIPTLKTICFITKDSPSGNALKKQVGQEKNTYLAQTKNFDLINSLKELQVQAEIANQQCDAMYMDSLEGITDKNSNPLVNKKVLEKFTEIYKGPVIGANRYHVVEGALSAVVKTGQEQGETAATMLLKAMQGTPINELPITQNYQGRRIINVSTMKALGIKPRPIVLRGATLVKTSAD